MKFVLLIKFEVSEYEGMKNFQPHFINIIKSNFSLSKLQKPIDIKVYIKTSHMHLNTIYKIHVCLEKVFINSL